MTEHSEPTPRRARNEDRERLRQMIEDGEQELGDEYSNSGLKFMHEQFGGLLDAEELNPKFSDDE